MKTSSNCKSLNVKTLEINKKKNKPPNNPQNYNRNSQLHGWKGLGHDLPFQFYGCL